MVELPRLGVGVGWRTGRTEATLYRVRDSVW